MFLLHCREEHIQKSKKVLTSVEFLNLAFTYKR